MLTRFVKRKGGIHGHRSCKVSRTIKRKKTDDLDHRFVPCKCSLFFLSVSLALLWLTNPNILSASVGSTDNGKKNTNSSKDRVALTRREKLRWREGNNELVLSHSLSNWRILRGKVNNGVVRWRRCVPFFFCCCWCFFLVVVIMMPFVCLFVCFLFIFLSLHIPRMLILLTWKGGVRRDSKMNCNLARKRKGEPCKKD